MDLTNGSGQHVNGTSAKDNGTIECLRPRGQLPNAPIKCKWRVGSSEPSPHSCKETQPLPKILPNILHAVGNTPVVKLNSIPQAAGLKCEMYVKCEFFSPGGSVKDRIAMRMVEDAEERGLIKPGFTIIEATSGNTGLGLAIACAVKGYKCIIVISEKMSNEKVDTLRALGAEIVRTPIEATSDAPDGLFAVAHKLNKSIPNSIVLNQYKNDGNPLAHYDGTAFELLNTFDCQIDMVVVAAGTGGTITGIGRKLKEACPSCKVVGVDPYGSILALPSAMNKTDVSFYEVEGIGYDFIPTALDRSVVDKWYKTEDKKSFAMARRLIREEGLLCGGSSGSVVYAALEAAKDLKEGQKCVVLLADGLRNYMTKFLDPIWLEARGLQEPEERPFPWWNKPVSSISVHKRDSILSSVTVKEAVNMMKQEKFNEIPIIDHDGHIRGVVNLSYVMKQINLSRVKPSDFVSKALYTLFRKVTPDTSLGLVSRILEKDSFVMVVQKPKVDGSAGDESSKLTETYLGLITAHDLLDVVVQNNDSL